MNIQEKAKKIKLLLLDVDGVMTDGSLIYSNKGDESKVFNVNDGLGIVLAKKQGLETAILTAKESQIVIKRAMDLKIEKVCQGFARKTEALEEIKKHFNVTDDEICFVGDDLLDIPVLKIAGLAIAVSNAYNEVKAVADHITEKCGGKGAVREVIEIILKAQGKWEEAVKQFDK